MFVLQSILEICVAVFIIWGLFNEDKFVKFEKRIVDMFKNKEER